jgi:predicted short-subunit dehydrogenase-like oxidoreductase (DUF2520 family)
MVARARIGAADAAGLPRRVAIRGKGRAGRALARALAAAEIPVVWIPRAGGRSPKRPEDLVVLAVPDDRIAAESERLAARGWRSRVVMHLSGALPAEAAAAWRRTGASVVSFHPLGSFAGDRAETAAGHAVAIEGDRRGAAEASRLARAIGARPWRIPAGRKALYHAAAAAAAGGTAAVVAQAARAAEAAGMPPEMAARAFASLAEEAARNVRRHGFPAGLTGPLARGDSGTLQLHRRALAGRPALGALYRALAAAARDALGRPPRRAPR